MSRKAVIESIRDAFSFCPDCANIEDEQYTCTTCWCQGGDGEINVFNYLAEHPHLVAADEMHRLRARIAELEAERAELVRNSKKEALTDLKEELGGGYCPPEERAGVDYAIDSINDSLEYLDAAREGE